MFFPKHHLEINNFFQNIEKLNERVANLLKKREENDLLERLEDFSGSLFKKLTTMIPTEISYLNEDILIKELALVNSIFSRFKLDVPRVIKAAKIAINSLKDLAADELKKIFTLIDELVDLIEFIWKKFSFKHNQ
jgi:hypothetical protein